MISLNAMSQNTDSVIIAEIYKNALTSYEAYNNLKVLCDRAGHRMMGSEKSILAVNILKQQLEKNGFDKVYLQGFETSIWHCNSKSKAVVSTKDNIEYALSVDALGPSVATPKTGIKAEVIEVANVEALKKLDKEIIKGKIVFFNTPMRNAYAKPIDAYVEAVMTRLYGTSSAAEYEAVGVIMRSLTTSVDEFPHTGTTVYNDKVKKIPVLAVSSKDAEKLSGLLKENPNLNLSIFVDTKFVDNTKSYNVIAEIKGKTNPKEVIVIGAHIDTWYNTTGAHDDGAGCVQVMDVLRIFKQLKINNNKTIRLILFMDEEINKSGAKAYADYFDNKKETIIAGIESDLGGFTPNGFFIDASDSIINNLQTAGKYLLPYGIFEMKKGFGGSDMIVLKKKFGFPSIALRVESQRYFEIIHTENDTFDKVNRRELQLGTAAIAGLVYFIDKYGIKKNKIPNLQKSSDNTPKNAFPDYKKNQ